MIKSTDIKPLTDFARNSKAHIQHLRETEAPEILTAKRQSWCKMLPPMSVWQRWQNKPGKMPACSPH